MTNHLHLIVNCDEPFSLKDAIRDFKRFTARTIIKQIIQEPESRRENFLSIFKTNTHRRSNNSMYKFWKSGNHAIEIYSEKFLWNKIHYIHNNPVVAKFVEKPEHWLYSSASNYLEEPSIFPEVIVLPQIMKSVNWYFIPQQCNCCGARVLYI